MKKSQDKVKANQAAIEQLLKKRADFNARLEKLEELAKNADEKKNEIEVRLFLSKNSWKRIMNQFYLLRLSWKLVNKACQNYEKQFV